MTLAWTQLLELTLIESFERLNQILQHLIEILANGMVYVLSDHHVMRTVDLLPVVLALYIFELPFRVELEIRRKVVLRVHMV